MWQEPKIVLGNGLESGHGELLRWQFHREPGGRHNLVSREGVRVDRVGEDTIRGGPQAPTVRLRRTSEATPTVVGICAAGHPRHRRRLKKPVEMALRDKFFQALFQGVGEGTPGRGVTRMPVKQAGLVLPELTKTAPKNCTASCVIIGHLVVAFRGQEDLRTVDHAAYMREGREEARKRNTFFLDEALADTLEGEPVYVARCLRWETKTGSCLTVQPSAVNRIELGLQEWQDSYFLQYSLDPPDLTKFCDHCNSAFSICHAFNFKKGSLVTARLNKLHDGVADLSENPLPQ